VECEWPRIFSLVDVGRNEGRCCAGAWDSLVTLKYINVSLTIRTKTRHMLQKRVIYRFDSSGRGPSNGRLLSLSVDRRRLWPVVILGSDNGAGDLLNRPGLRSG
jgi:hypothetical protein